MNDRDLQDICAHDNPLRVIKCEAALADSAYLIYAEMKRAEIRHPFLAYVPAWTQSKAWAWTAFCAAFEVTA